MKEIIKKLLRETLNNTELIKNDNISLDVNNMSEDDDCELTEKCWKGYTQKGMKTMFGKRYPNCVKKTK